MAYVSTQLKNAWAFASDKDSPYLVRKRKFSFGLWLAIWPVVVAAFLPSRLFAILHANLLSNDRLPVAIVCIVAVISEAAAALLFFFTRRRYLDRPEDRLTFWSVIATAAAGACAIAFLAAAAVNAMHV